MAPSQLLQPEAARACFDLRGRRPTAESVAEKLGIPVRTVREWLGDNGNAELLGEIVPLWPNIGSARPVVGGTEVVARVGQRPVEVDETPA